MDYHSRLQKHPFLVSITTTGVFKSRIIIPIWQFGKKARKPQKIQTESMAVGMASNFGHRSRSHRSKIGNISRPGLLMYVEQEVSQI